jgi:4-amino-4-deoxy-L-arabinose transferase-like glycosyltransferase
VQNRSNFLTKNSFVLRALLLSLIVKLFLAYLLPVVGDESYYLVWGQYLQLSYFDHPPAVAWLTWISNQLYSVFPLSWFWLSIRLPFIIISTVTFLIWLKAYLFEQNEDANVKSFTILYFLNPLLGLGGIFATPDIPLLFFWSMAYYAILKIRATQFIKWYAILGVSLGLGFCSKYHIVVLPISMIIALFFLKDLKSIQIKKLIYTVIFGFIFSLPVVIWNYQNEWSSFLFQLNHGFNAEKKYNFMWTISYLVGQVILFNPIILFYLFKNVKKSLTKNVALSQWGFFVFSSFKAIVEANWPVTSHAQGLLGVKSDFKKYFKFSVFYWCLIWLVLIGLIMSPVSTEKLVNIPQSYSAREIYNLTKAYRPLFGPTYQLSSLMHAISNEPIYKLDGLSRLDFYDYLKSSLPSDDMTNFYVLKYVQTTWPEWVDDYKIEKVLDLPKYQLELYELSYE